MITFTKNIGFILLAIYLILIGVVALVPAISIPAMVSSVIGVLAGIFILLGK